MKRAILFVCALAAVTPAVAAVSFEQAVQGWLIGSVSARRDPDGHFQTCDTYRADVVQNRTLTFNWRVDRFADEVFKAGLGGRMLAALAPVTVQFMASGAPPNEYLDVLWANRSALEPLKPDIAAALIRAGIAPDVDLLPVPAAESARPDGSGCATGRCDCMSCPPGAKSCDCLKTVYEDPRNPTLPTGCVKTRVDCDYTDWGPPMRDGPLPLPLTGMSASGGDATH